MRLISNYFQYFQFPQTLSLIYKNCLNPSSSIYLKNQYCTDTHSHSSNSDMLQFLKKRYPVEEIDSEILEQRTNLVGLNVEELIEVLEPLKLEKYRAQQIYNHINVQGAKDFTTLTTIKKAVRNELEKKFMIHTGKVIKKQESLDGTIKWLINFDGKNQVETVFIPEEAHEFTRRRGTLCISSQVGCTLSCKLLFFFEASKSSSFLILNQKKKKKGTFCHTGTQKVTRNLTFSEIVSQLLVAKDGLNDFPSSKPEKVITNLVFMGQGEPGYNFRNVTKAIKILTDGAGLAISRKKVIVSTSGVVPIIEKMDTDLPKIGLAISLHAVDNETRSKIVPLNDRWNIQDIMKALKKFPATKFNKICFEYVMLQNINDSIQEAESLVRLILHNGLHESCIVNLIPFNPWEGSTYVCSSKKQIERFAEILEKKGITVVVRKTRGADIDAACGMLNTHETTLSQLKEKL